MDEFPYDANTTDQTTLAWDNFTSDPVIYSQETTTTFIPFETSKFVESNFARVQLSAELYIMTACISVALLMNFSAIFLWFKNRKVFSLIRCSVCSLIVADQLYLLSLLPYLIYRRRDDDALNSKELDGKPFNGVGFQSLVKHIGVQVKSRDTFIEGLETTTYLNTTNSTTVQIEVDTLYFVHYITVVVGTFQCFSTWMLYVCASEANRILRRIILQHSGRALNRAFPVILFLLILFYFSFFLPEVRYLIMNHANSEYFFHNVTIIPFQNHWDFVLNETSRKDILYIICFSLLYILTTYIFPYVLVVSVDKSLIDVMHAAQREQKSASSTPASLLMSRRRRTRKGAGNGGSLKKISGRSQQEKEKPVKRGMPADSKYVRERYLYPSLVVSVTCNVFLVCVALKMIILIFKLFEFAHSYVTDARVFFKYLNVYSNFVQLLKAVIHLPAVAMYDYNVKRYLILSLRSLKRRLMRKRETKNKTTEL